KASKKMDADHHTTNISLTSLLEMEEAVIKTDEGSEEEQRRQHARSRREEDWAEAEDKRREGGQEPVKKGKLYYQVQPYTKNAMNEICTYYQSDLRKAPKVVFSDDYTKKYRRDDKKGRVGDEGQAKCIGPYDRIFGHGICTTTNNGQLISEMMSLSDYNRLLLQEFLPLQMHLQQGYDVIFPSLGRQDMQSDYAKASYFDRDDPDKLVVFHNLNAAPSAHARLSSSYLAAIQAHIDALRQFAASEETIRMFDITFIQGDYGWMQGMSVSDDFARTVDTEAVASATRSTAANPYTCFRAATSFVRRSYLTIFRFVVGLCLLLIVQIIQKGEALQTTSIMSAIVGCCLVLFLLVIPHSFKVTILHTIDWPDINLIIILHSIFTLIFFFCNKVDDQNQNISHIAIPFINFFFINKDSLFVLLFLYYKWTINQFM
ncbi:hypothetical protein RFI_16911, partial [Reticulomyxa filosa]